jgi:GNAT superfamily N-acetyltransferase
MKMIEILQPEKVLCRPALSKDTEQVMELCSHIWEGGDYIPHVWDRWLDDPVGLLGVAELSGRVVGVFKLTKFQDNEWYLEGLRVHPDFQGKGIAAHIHEYVVDTWRLMGGGIVRLVTASYNVKVHHMCEQDGFTRIAEFVPYRAPALREESNNFSSLPFEEAQRALEFVSESWSHIQSACLINLGWVYANPLLKHLQEAINNKHAWWWRGGQGFISIWEDDEDNEREPGIQLIGCAPIDLAGLLVDYRRLVDALGYKSAGWVAPFKPEIVSNLEKVGFERGWDKSLYVYELRSNEK